MPKARRQLLAAARAVCLDNRALWCRDMFATARAELPDIKIEKLSDLPDDFLARIVAGRVDVTEAAAEAASKGLPNAA